MRGVTATVEGLNAIAAISTHTPHARRDSLALSSASFCSLFQLTRLMRGVTTQIRYTGQFHHLFQLTRLMRGVTPSPSMSGNGNEGFQLTRLMRGVTLQSFVCSVAIFISTHTPHARRDTGTSRA